MSQPRTVEPGTHEDTHPAWCYRHACIRESHEITHRSMPVTVSALDAEIRLQLTSSDELLHPHQEPGTFLLVNARSRVDEGSIEFALDVADEAWTVALQVLGLLAQCGGNPSPLSAVA